jgi:hypothetical protein
VDTSFIVLIASSIVKLLGFWIGGKSLISINCRQTALSLNPPPFPSQPSEAAQSGKRRAEQRERGGQGNG